jgi:FKBP-type peptidyl-prolyl cis-trans isomerase
LLDEQYKSAQNGLFGDIVKGQMVPNLLPMKTGTLTYKGWLTNGKLFDASRPNTDGSVQPFVVTLGAQPGYPWL